MTTGRVAAAAARCFFFLNILALIINWEKWKNKFSIEGIKENWLNDGLHGMTNNLVGAGGVGTKFSFLFLSFFLDVR